MATQDTQHSADPSPRPDFSPRSFMVDDQPPAAGPAGATRATETGRTGRAGGRWPRAVATLGIAGALLLSAVGGGAIGAALTRGIGPSPGATPAPVLAVPAGAPRGAAAPTSLVADIYRQVNPAVVRISQQNGLGGGGAGAGFIIDQDGSILTNNHVVEGARSLTVTLSDGQEFTATVLGRSPGNDIALIKIDPPAAGLTVAALGDSSTVAPGDIAVAIGSPLGLDKTVTSGIVSAINRDVNTYQARLTGLIQTDAAINPGNSGGPLLNAKGEVIGINTLGALGTNGIGFAVPINTAKQLLPTLKAGGTTGPNSGANSGANGGFPRRTRP